MNENKLLNNIDTVINNLSKKVNDLEDFKKTVLPYLQDYIQLMKMVGNHSAVAGLEIYLLNDFNKQLTDQL